MDYNDLYSTTNLFVAALNIVFFKTYVGNIGGVHNV